MPKIREVLVYEFDELSDSAKDKARQWARENLFDHDWWEGTFEAVKTAAACLGIDISDIYFSGFWSQGDGACFTGKYSYKETWKEEASKEFGGELLTEIMCFGEKLESIQKQARHSLEATIRHTDRYFHARSMDIDVEMDTNAWDSVADIFGEEGMEAMMEQEFEATENDLIETLRSYADWIYKLLEEDYYAQTSDEELGDLIRANEYEFDEDGEIA